MGPRRWPFLLRLGFRGLGFGVSGLAFRVDLNPKYPTFLRDIYIYIETIIRSPRKVGSLGTR